MGFSRQEYQSELPFPHPGHRHPGIAPMSPALAGELPLAPTGKLLLKAYFVLNIMLKNLFRFIFKLYKLMTQVVCYHHKRHVVKSSKFLLSYNPVMSVSQSMPTQFVADRVTAFQPPARVLCPSSQNLWIYYTTGKEERGLQTELRLLTSWLYNRKTIPAYQSRANISTSVTKRERGRQKRSRDGRIRRT